MVATRSGGFPARLMLATALAVFWCCRTAAEPTRRKGDKRVQATLSPCAAPRFRTSTGIRACLHKEQGASLPGCRGFISPGAHRPRRAAAERQMAGLAQSPSPYGRRCWWQGTLPADREAQFLRLRERIEHMHLLFSMRRRVLKGRSAPHLFETHWEMIGSICRHRAKS